MPHSATTRQGCRALSRARPAVDINDLTSTTPSMTKSNPFAPQPRRRAETGMTNPVRDADHHVASRGAGHREHCPFWRANGSTTPDRYPYLSVLVVLVDVGILRRRVAVSGGHPRILDAGLDGGERAREDDAEVPLVTEVEEEEK